MQQHVNITTPSFGDIVPAVERVDIRGTVIQMRGIPGLQCFELIEEFPAVMNLLNGKYDVAKLLKEVPQAAAALACEGLGRAKDEKERKKFHQLVLGDQVKLLTAVLKATMPEGRDPFVDLGIAVGYLEPRSTSGKP